MGLGKDFNIYLKYEEKSPSFLVWARDIGRRFKAGEVAGSLNNSTGRWKVCINRHTYYASRVIWEMFNGEIPAGMVVDHIDRNKLNNNIDNLRAVSQEVNSRNRNKNSNNRTGVTGIHRISQVWDDPIYHYDTVYEYYSATWRDASGKNYAKYFSIKRYGEENAFNLACEYRRNMLLDMDIGYTDQHGK